MPSDTHSQDFKARDAASYDAVTQEFDRFTEQLLHPLAGHVVARAELRPSDRVLDVGTGTGVVALAAARRLDAGSVCGIDLSDGMLAVAKAKAQRLGLESRTEFRQMDAENLDLADQSFDAVLSLFALMHFPDAARALEEMRRVLRPGGRLVAAVGSGPPLLSADWWVAGWRRAGDLWRERSGRLLMAPHFLDSLVNRMLPAQAPEAEETELAAHSRNRAQPVARMVRDAGFENITAGWVGHRAEVDSLEDFWDMQRTFSSIARKRLGGASPEQRQKVRRQFEDSCRDVLERGGKLVYPFGAFVVVAQRPEEK